MNEKKRFTMEKSEGQDIIYDNEGLDDYYHLGNDTRDVKALCNLLNEQEEIIQQLKWSNKILRANRKDCEFGRRNERKNWEKLDKMRIEHIRFLQKRLKENGLSIYINGDD